MSKPTITAILLAAGSSTRMGKTNKLLLPFGESLMIQLRLTQIQNADIDELIVVLGHEAEKVKAHLPKGVSTVFNDQHLKGMTSSIQAGVKATNPMHQGFMICLADQVLMQTLDYNHIITAWGTAFVKNPNLIAVPTFENRKGNPVIFSSNYRQPILEHQMPDGCKEIVRENRQHVEQVMMLNDRILKDVDTMDEYNAGL